MSLSKSPAHAGSGPSCWWTRALDGSVPYWHFLNDAAPCVREGSGVVPESSCTGHCNMLRRHVCMFIPLFTFIKHAYLRMQAW